MRVRAAQEADEIQWRAIWRGYNLFYETPDLSGSITQATWDRILDAKNAIFCLVAEENGQLLGFINYVVHPRTWSEKDCCYLEDLFVAAAARGKGVARALCDALKASCKEQGLSRIYWNTREGNVTARAFYDQIGRTDDFIRYVMEL